MKKKNNILITLFVACWLPFSGISQIVTKQLISKMDIAPQHELWDGNKTMLMGFTELFGTPIDLPSPVLVFYEGDSVELKLRNMSQPAPHTIHLHGLDVDQQNDGVPHLSFDVGHDETKSYFFKVPHPGTYLYHCHVVSSLHVQSGMYGMIIVKPSDESNTTWDGGYAYDNEYAWLMSELDTIWHHDSIINKPHTSMTPYKIPVYNPQYFLVNGRSENQLSNPEISVSAAVNEMVYLRLANVGNYGNRVILPSSLNAKVISSDGRPLPVEEDTDTAVILPGERFGVLINPLSEFTDSIEVEYFDLNTQVVKNTQKIPIKVAGFLGIDETEITENIEVFPNPAKGSFSVRISGDIKRVKALKVYDILGKEIFHYSGEINKNEKITINSDSWDDGVYFIRLYSKDKSTLKKLIIKN